VELRHLRYFVAVAEEGHFGRAAARLHLSTPTLSQQIRALEAEIGARLLVRHPRGATVSAAGEALLSEARTALRAADAAAREARRAAGLTDGALRIGLLTGAHQELVSRLKAILAEEAPDARALLIAGDTSHQLGLLERGELDIAILRAPVDLSADSEQLELQRDELGVLMAASHPLAAREQLSCRDLSGEELIWFPRRLNPGFHDATLEALQRDGARLTIATGAMEVPSIAAALPQMPAAISLSTPRMAELFPELAWRPLVGSPITVTIAAVWRKPARQPALRALIRGLRRTLREGLWREAA
jgi:DNA-binding transcriptional LysR family regulator